MDQQAPATNPFLPGTNIRWAWDSTCLSALKTCPRLYQYQYILGYAPRGDSVHLRFGQEYHAAIEDYDKLRHAGANFDDAVRTTIRNLLLRIRDFDPDTDTKAGQYKNPATLLQLVVDYLDEYRNDPATTYVLANGKPAVELSFKFELGFGPGSHKIGMDGPDGEPWGTKFVPYTLCGHLDRVVDLGGALWVLDHKTTTTTPSAYYFDGFNPNNQMTLYTLAAQVVYHAPVKGILIEAAQIKLSEPSRFERSTTFRTQDQLEEWLRDTEVHLRQAEAYAIADHFPMNDTSCDKFGGCRFRGVCSKSPATRDVWLKSDFVKLDPQDMWNPLKPR